MIRSVFPLTPHANKHLVLQLLNRCRGESNLSKNIRFRFRSKSVQLKPMNEGRLLTLNSPLLMLDVFPVSCSMFSITQIYGAEQRLLTGFVYLFVLLMTYDWLPEPLWKAIAPRRRHYEASLPRSLHIDYANAAEGARATTPDPGGGSDSGWDRKAGAMEENKERERDAATGQTCQHTLTSCTG